MKIYFFTCIFSILSLCNLTTTAQTQNILSFPDIAGLGGSSVSIPFYLDNEDNVTAVQFTIDLPEGCTLNTSTAQLTDRSNDHNIIFREIGTQQYMCMIFSQTNKGFNAHSGKLFSIDLNVSANLQEDHEYEFVIRDAVVTNADGSNILTGIEIGKLFIMKSCDLIIENVRCDKQNYAPEEQITVAWQVTNIGDIASSGGWKEDILLVGGNGHEKLIGSVYYNNILDSKTSVSRQATIMIPQITGVSGDCDIKVKLAPYSDNVERPEHQQNNSTQTTEKINLSKTIYINIPSENINEDVASPIKCTLARSGNFDNNEIFYLSFENNDGRLTIPASLTIPTGASENIFYISTNNNDIIDRDNTVTLNVTSDSYESKHTYITVTDDELPTLTLSAASVEIAENEDLILTVTNEITEQEDVIVNINCDASSRFTYPEQVIIPQNEDRVSFTVHAIEDETADTSKDITFTATANKHIAGEAIVILQDNDIPQLELEIYSTEICENAGINGITGVVRRLDKTGQDITVEFYDNSDNALLYPYKKIEMKSGVEAVEFSIGVIDNAIVDGNKEIEITAAVHIASCSCSAPSASVGVSTKKITILDDDGPAISIRTNNSTFKEGELISVTISRNTNTENELSVNISSNNDTMLTYQNSITIPAGEESIEVPIQIGHNNITDDSQIIVMTASATDYTNGTCWIMVTDQTLPDAQITNITSSENEIYVGDIVNVNVEVSNNGAAILKAPIQVDIVSENSSDALCTLYTLKDIAVGESEILTGTIKLPNTLGEHKIMAVANKERKVKELQYANNTSAHITVNQIPLFSANATTDKSIYMQGDSIIISGNVSGEYVSECDVEVYIINNGLRQVLQAITDEEGNFTTTYKPYEQQSGHFVVGACYPGENSTEEQSTFNIYGLSCANNSYITCETLISEVYEGYIPLYNPCNLELTDVKAEVVSKPMNCDIRLNEIGNIQGNENVALNFELLCNAVTNGYNWETIDIRITTAEGVSLNTVLYYYCRSSKGQLTANIANINTTMVKDSSRDFPITITNTGKGDTGEITFSLPSWITTATPNHISNLTSGESSTIVLRFNPTDDMQLNVPICGQIGINCKNGNGLPLHYEITPVSESTGQLIVDVCDEYTYYTEEAPHVSGATVIIKHPTTGAIISQGKTGEDGIYSIELPEGYYGISITADKHDSYTNNILIDPGVDNKLTINLSYQAITVDWNAEEIEIEDKYELTSTVKYETNVPVPVLEVIWPDELPGEFLTSGTCIINAVITNKGLITAQDVTVNVEDGDGWNVEVLGANNIDLQPSATIVIPVKISINNNEANKIAARADKVIIDTKLIKCYIKTETLTYWDCGKDRKWHLYEKQLRTLACDFNFGDKEPDNTKGGFDWPDIRFPKIPWPFPKPEPGPGPAPGPDPDPDPIDSTTIQRPIEIIDTGCIPCIMTYIGSAFKCIPVIGTAVGFVEDASDCLGAIADNDKLSRMIADCPFSSVFGLLPEEVLGIADVAYDFHSFASSLSNPFITTEEKYAAFEKFKDTGEELIGKWENMPEKYKGKAKEAYDNFVDTKNRFLEAIDDAKNKNFDNLHKESHALLDKGKDLLENINEVGEFIDEEGKKLPKPMKVAKHLGKFTCVVDLLAPCDKEPGTEVANLARTILNENTNNVYEIKRTNTQRSSVSNSAIEEYQTMLRHIVNASDAEDNIRIELLGDAIWGDVDWYEFWPLYLYLTNSEYIVYNEATEILRPSNISVEDFKKLLNRWKACYIDNRYNEYINFEYIREQIEIINESAKYLENSGYTTYKELFTAKSDELLNNLSEGSKSVCSSITLQFSQTMTMTRQAFRGTLSVFNGNETTEMKDIRLHIDLRNEDGILATSKEFQINAESLDKFTGEVSLDSDWSLAPNETGIATILFIPTKYAAPTKDVVYSFGGTLSYIDPYTNIKVTRDLFPVKLTVKPSPQLNMTYFMQRDIYGDDPLTKDVVEPIIPAEFSLLIHNVGYGDAKNVMIETKQPQIIDNEKGLAIDFNIIDAQLNGKEHNMILGGNIPTNFGTIKSDSTVYAQWWIQSSLLGHFTDYDIEASHITSYGNENLTLLNEVTIHELIRSVGYTSENGKHLTGFIVNEITDANDMPDMIYLTDGSIESVAVTNNITVNKISNTEYNFTLTPDSTGWNYGYIKDPTAGKQNIVSVTRSDSKNIDIRNIWQTDRVLRDGKEHLYENRIHIADKIDLQSITYTVIFEPKPKTTLEIKKFDNIPAEGEIATSPIREICVQFNKDIKPETFTYEDITLSIQGDNINLENIGINRIDNATYMIDLSALPTSNGYYSLTVQTSGITDEEGFNGDYGKSVGWIFFLDNKLDVTIGVSPENSGTVNLASGYFEYGENIELIATPNDGYNFAGWSIDDEIISDETTYNKILNKDIVIDAKFTHKFHNINIEANDANGNIIGAGSGIYKHGEELVLSVVAAKNYCLEGWYIDGVKVSEENTYIHIVTGDAHIEARFIDIMSTYSISVNLNSIGDSKLITNFEYDRLATFSANFATLLPENIAAYYATSEGINDEYISLTQYDGTILPANEGFILAGDIETVLLIGCSKEATLNTENKLGNTANGPIELSSGQCYLLASGSDGAGFYACSAGILAMNKAYLNIPASSGISRSIVLRFPGTTNIDNVTISNNEYYIYTLDGRMLKKGRNENPANLLQDLEPGIYIINGRKIYKR